MKGEYALKKIHSLKRIQQVEEPENGCLEDDFYWTLRLGVWAYFQGRSGRCIFLFIVFFSKVFVESVIFAEPSFFVVSKFSCLQILVEKGP